MTNHDDRTALTTPGAAVADISFPDLEVLRQLPPIVRYSKILAAGGTCAEAHAIMLCCQGASDPAFYIAPSRISQLAERVSRT